MKFGNALRILSILILLGGCVDNDQSVVIVGNYVLTEDCETPTDNDAELRGRGRFDIGLAAALNRGYLMIPRVKNQLPPTAMAGGGGGMGGQGMMPIEMNGVFLEGWEVEIEANPEDPIAEVLQPGVPGLTRLAARNAGGLLTPGGGQLTGPVEVFSAATAAMLLGNRLVKPGPAGLGEVYQSVNIRLRARTKRSGMVIYSQWFEFPLELCAFCNVLKPGTTLSGYNPGSGSLFECPDPSMLTEESLASACLPAQDSFVSCCILDRQALCGLAIPHKAKSS